jgi:hypothetical protein
MMCKPTLFLFKCHYRLPRFRTFERIFLMREKNKGGTIEKMESAAMVSASLALWRRYFYGCGWALHLAS